MLFSVFCGVSLFDILLIIFATYTYFKNRRLSKQFDNAISELSVNKEGQVFDKEEVDYERKEY